MRTCDQLMSICLVNTSVNIYIPQQKYRNRTNETIKHRPSTLSTSLALVPCANAQKRFLLGEMDRKM